MLHCYQRADEAQLRKALESRHKSSRLIPIGGNQMAGIRPGYARKFNNHINIQNCGRLPSRLRGTITSI